MPLEIPPDQPSETPLADVMHTMATVVDIHERLRVVRQHVRSMEKVMAYRHKQYRRGMLELQEMQELMSQLAFDVNLLYPPAPAKDIHPLATTLKQLAGTPESSVSPPEQPQITDVEEEEVQCTLDTNEPDSDSDVWWKQ